MSEKKFNKTQYDNNYAKQHYKRYLFELNRKTDSQLIEWLDKQANKKQAIKSALLKEIKK